MKHLLNVDSFKKIFKLILFNPVFDQAQYSSKILNGME